MAQERTPGERSESSTAFGQTASLELLELARTGDREARERLFARYYPRVFRVVRARMGARLRAFEAPEDIVQSTFLAALGAIERFEAREDAALIDWFAVLIEHQIRDAAKHHTALKRDVEREVSLESLGVAKDAACFEPQATDTPTLERLALAEEMRVLDECMADLPDPEREALVLRDHALASWALIAERLGRPSEAAARELYRRAQLRLMERFQRRTGRDGGRA
jgi:RNA polymerase sigma factor (sigma-70 family)